MSSSIKNRDYKKIAKIRKLLNLANSKTNVHEADLSASLAKNLMKKHGYKITDILVEDSFYEPRLSSASKTSPRRPETKHKTHEAPAFRLPTTKHGRDKTFAPAPVSFSGLVARGLSGGLLFYIIIKLLVSI